MAWAIGVFSVLVFAWFVTLGRGDPTQARTFSNVFDLQARSILHGRLSVPDGSLAFEGFVVGGRTYTYFGIFPSLLRLPVFVLTDRFDGQLTAVSMLMAYAIALWSVGCIIERTHRLMRPRSPWTRPGLVASGLLLVVCGVGSNLLFLASGAWVYHEAALWGVAGVLASFAAILRFIDRPTLRTVVVAGAWATVAWTSRGSVGLAPSAVLGLLGLALVTGHRWFSVVAPPPESAGHDLVTRPLQAELGGGGPTRPDGAFIGPTWARSPRLGGALVAAALVGALIFGVLNSAKFGSPTALPIEKQVASDHPWPERRAALKAYDGGLFSARLVPSVLIQTFRPDLIEPTGSWPFVRFGNDRPPVWGNLVFDTVEPSSGLTVSSPLLLVLAGVGAVSVLRRRLPPATPGPDGGNQPRGSAAFLRPFLLGGLAAVGPPLTIAFIAQRYLTDALPLLVVASAAGVVVLDGWANGRSGGADRGPRSAVAGVRPALAGLGVLAVVGVALTMSLTWSYQRFVIPPDPAALAAGVRTQIAVSRVVGSPPPFTRYDRLPARSAGFGLAVRGDCLGLYWGRPDGTWEPVEVSAQGGDHRLRVRLDAPVSGPTALLGLDGNGDVLVVSVVMKGKQVHLQLVHNGVRGVLGDPVDLGGSDHLVVVRADPARRAVEVQVDGRDVLFQPGPAPVTPTPAIGSDPTATIQPFTGTVVPEPTPTPTCRALVKASG